MTLKIILVGDAGVGKTNILIRYSTNDRPAMHTISTAGVDFLQIKRTFELGGKPTSVLINGWDSAGQEKFRSMIRRFFVSTHGALLVFDITNRQSFQSLGQWMEMLTQEQVEHIVICGNKADLKAGRKVTTEEALAAAQQFGVPYFETSAYTGEDVDNAFRTLVERCFTTYKQEQSNTFVQEVEMGPVGEKCCGK